MYYYWPGAFLISTKRLETRSLATSNFITQVQNAQCNSKIRFQKQEGGFILFLIWKQAKTKKPC